MNAPSEKILRLPRSYAHAPVVPAGKRVTIEELVPGSGPVLLEIGAGRGAFTREYAALHPTHRVLAFEIKRKLCVQLDERLTATPPFNARCFADDAQSALERIDPASSVDFVAIHFPDPWWKKRHEKRLVVRDALVPELARLVRSGGIVFVQTDVEDRANTYASVMGQGGWFAPDERVVTESPFAPARSNRERRAIQDGLPIHRYVFVRTARSC